MSAAAIGTLKEQIAATTARILGTSSRDIDCAGSFASLGIDSLGAAQLAAALEDELGIRVSPIVLYEHSSIDRLCGFIESGSSVDDSVARFEQMRADAVLPADIAPTGLGVATRDAHRVLLTGATGFVGAYVLRCLLAEDPQSIVTCLVRPSPVDGLTRVRQSLARFGAGAVPLGRVRIVTADLTRPLLGLKRRELDHLATSVDAIVHAAARVDWVQSYGDLRAANVLGTRELLRLACVGVPKPFHFVSSISVCHSTAAPRSVDEAFDPLRSLEGFHFGYAQAKSVAEALVRQAAERGLPATIIRPSLVGGDSVTGATNPDDLTSRFIAGCIHMGAAPDLDWRMDIVPVDDVARAIVRLARAHDDGLAVRHLVAPHQRHWRETVLWMRLRGYALEFLPYREWSHRLEHVERDHPLYPLRPFFLNSVAAENGATLPELFEESRRPAVRDNLSRASLARLGATPREITSRLLERYVDHLAVSGVIPATPNPKPRRRFAQLLTDSVRSILEANVGSVESLSLERIASDDSIVAELVGWRDGTETGLFVAHVDWKCANDADHPSTMFVKVKGDDEQVLEVARAVAGMASSDLADAIDRFAPDLGLTRAQERELAIYGDRDPRLVAHMPRVYGTRHDQSARRWIIAMEHLDQASLADARDITWWSTERIESALRGLAAIHAIGWGREDTLKSRYPLPPARDAQRHQEMLPLWHALAHHAFAHAAAWSSHARLRQAHENALAQISEWSQVLDESPRTLIHNDFNPRNIALRGPDASLCVFDWELSTIGAPQRDLAELLCFVLPPNASAANAAHWVDRYRQMLEAETGVSLSPHDWEVGFGAAMNELLVDRLASYAMVSRVRHQGFLTRVVESWLNLATTGPLAGNTRRA